MFSVVDKIVERFMHLSSRRFATVTAAAAAVTAAIVALLYPMLSVGVQCYNDIVVGEITYANAYKHGDIQLSFVAVACFFLSWSAFILLPEKRTAEVQAFCSDGRGFDGGLAVGICSFFAGLLLLRSGFPIAESIVLLALLAVYCTDNFIGRARITGQREGDSCRESSSPNETAVIWGVSVCGIYFSTIGVLALIQFFAPKLFAGKEAVLCGVPVYAACAGGLGLLLTIRSSVSFRRNIAKLCQVTMPLLLILYFGRVVSQNGIVSSSSLPLRSKAIGLAIVTAGVLLNLLDMKRKRNESDRHSYLLVWSIIAAVALLGYTPPDFKQIDFFHTGELLLAWQQVFEYGQMPYTGFAWARGWSDAFPGMLTKVMYDGTFSSFDMGFNAMGMLISGLAAYFLCRALGLLWGGLLSILAAQSGIYRWWLYLPILLILISPGLLKKPLRWLSVWLLLSVVHCLFQATSGIALLLGTLPVAVWMAWLSWKNGELSDAWRRHRPVFILSIVAIGGFFFSVAPLLSGLVSYIHDQGMVNEIANGTVLNRPTRIPEWFRWKSKPVWELFRVGGWLIGIILVWHFLMEELRRRNQDKLAVPGAAVVAAIVSICSMIVFIPYSMGRIDSAGLSRTGSLSVFILAVLLPLMLKLSSRNRSISGAVYCGFLLSISLVPSRIDPAAIAKRALSPAVITPDMVWFNGAENGLPRIGNTFIQGEQIQMIAGFKRVSDAMLKPGETYYDLTNFLAHYYFFDKRVSSIYAGYYIVTSEQLQNRVINALEKSPPPLVLAGPAREFRSGPASLRSYRVYRWFIRNNYIPLVINGMCYLVSGERYNQLQIPLPAESVMNDNLSAVFAHDPIGMIPVAWGASFDALSFRFERVKPAGIRLSSAGVKPATGVWPVVNRTDCSIEGGVDGGRADFILIRLDAQKTPEPFSVKLHWPGSGKPDNMLEFLAVPGIPLLVPAGSHPAWLRTGNISRLSIEVAGSNAAVKQIEFLHLKK